MEPTEIAIQPASAPTPDPTPANEWSRTAEGLYRLPGSGNVARLRRVSLIALASAGAIPNPLSQDVLRYLARQDPQGRIVSEETQVAEYRRNAKAFMQIAQRVLVEPRLWLPAETASRGKGESAPAGPDYAAGEIGPEDLADNDYTWIFFSFVGGDANWRETFRVG